MTLTTSGTVLSCTAPDFRISFGIQDTNRKLIMRYLILLLVVTACGCDFSYSKSTDNGDAESRQTQSSEGPFDNWETEFATMADVLKLSATDKQSLESVFRKHLDIYQQWDTKNGDEYRSSFNEMVDATKNKDLERMRNISPHAKQLRKEYLQIISNKENDVVNSLSDENRAKWIGHLIATHFFEIADGMEFSDEQRSSIHEAAVTAAAKVKDHANPKAAGFVEFEKLVERNVFNEIQRKQYDTVKDKNKLRTLTF